MVAGCSESSVLQSAENRGCQRDDPPYDSESTNRELDARLEHGSVWRCSAGAWTLALSAEEFLMTRAALLFVFAGILPAQPRIDNVLEKMVPPGATSLVGARMDLIKQTAIYRKMIGTSSLAQLDQFAAETGFDPRRDVRDILLASTASGTVLLARGTFHWNAPGLTDVRKFRHGKYEIIGKGEAGFCILDPTLAAAGDVKTLEAALDE